MRAVNLIPADSRKGAGGAAGRSGGGAYILLGALALIVAMAAAYTVTGKSEKSKKSQLADISAQATAAEAKASQLNDYTAFAALRVKRVDTVKQLARLSGVSIRTLHHYDEIGLLKPAFTGENRYRYYGREELLRLQDILFHRELGVPLQEIGKLLDLQGRDRAAMLAEHREWLDQRIKRSRQLLRTIDRTIAELNGEGPMDDKDIYKGFAPEKQAEYEDWLVERGLDVGRSLPVVESAWDKGVWIDRR